MRLTTILFVASCCAFAQSDKGSAPTPAKTVTVSGCLYPGVECLVFKNLKGKQDYSIVKNDKLQIGHSYRITGPVRDVGFCQEGKPILGAQKITELRLKCETTDGYSEKK